MFINELRWDESDGQKRDKIHALKLNKEEWERVNTFLDLLTVRVYLCIHGSND